MNSSLIIANAGWRAIDSCLGFWKLWLPRACPETAQKLNIGQPFYSLKTFQPNFIAILVFSGTVSSCIGFPIQTHVYTDHFTFVWIMHYSLGTEWMMLISQRSWNTKSLKHQDYWDCIITTLSDQITSLHQFNSTFLACLSTLNFIRFFWLVLNNSALFR